MTKTEIDRLYAEHAELVDRLFTIGLTQTEQARIYSIREQIHDIQKKRDSL